jgi:hypothetical protein
MLNPTYERWTDSENRTGPNLWLLGNNRRDAVSIRRCVDRIKNTNGELVIFKQFLYDIGNDQRYILAQNTEFVNS